MENNTKNILNTNHLLMRAVVSLLLVMLTTVSAWAQDDLIRLTFKMPGYNLDVNKFESITQPVQTTRDGNGDLVLWYQKGTNVKIDWPMLEKKKQTPVRLFYISNVYDYSFIEEDAVFTYYWLHSDLSTRVQVGTTEQQFDCDATIYNIWNFDVPRYDTDFWGETTLVKDPTDEAYYQRVRFVYDKSKVVLNAMPDNCYHKEDVDEGRIYKYLVWGEPFFFKAEGADGYYVSDVKISFKYPGTDTGAGPYNWYQWMDVANQSDDYPDSRMHYRTATGGLYEFGVCNPYSYPCEAVITIEAKPKLKLDVQLTGNNGLKEDLRTQIINYGGGTSLNDLRPSDYVAFHPRQKNGYIFDYGQIDSRYGLFKTNGERYSEGLNVAETPDPTVVQYFSVRMGEEDLVLKIDVRPDPEKIFGINFEDVIYNDDLQSYVSQTSDLGRIWCANYEEAFFTEGCVGERIAILDDCPEWVEVKSLIVESTDPNVDFSEDITTSRVFYMPNAPVSVKCVFGLNTDAGYRKADLVFNNPFGDYSTAYFYSGEGGDDSNFYKFPNQAQKRIVKVGEAVSVNVLLTQAASNSSNYKMTIEREENGHAVADVCPANVFTVPDADGNITVRVDLFQAYRVYTSELGNKGAYSEISRSFVPAGTPVNVTTVVDNSKLGGLGETYDVVFNLYSNMVNENAKEAQLESWDIGDSYTFSMPAGDVLVYADELWYMDASVETTGKGTVTLNAPQRGPVRTDGIVKVRERDRVSVDANPAPGYHVKNVWLEWTRDINAATLADALAVAAPTALNSDGNFTVPYFKPEQNSYKRNTNVVVHVEFEMDAPLTLFNDDQNEEYRNNELIANNLNAGVINVCLNGRTLYKDGMWNTLCLPFNVTIAESLLAGAEARTVTAANITGTTLYLTFSNPVTELQAGVPYIIKWDNDTEHSTIDNPTFTGVTLNNANNDFNNGIDGDLRVRFIGTYNAKTLYDEDKSILFMGGGNHLYYPNGDAPTYINAFRCYFKIGNGDPLARAISNFSLAFGSEPSSIERLIQDHFLEDGAWYSLDGRRINGRPAQKGVYIMNGKKVVVK